MSERAYDGKWGNEIRQRRQIQQQTSELAKRLSHLRRIAIEAQKLFPGPWAVSEANFVVCDYLNGDPETGKPVAEVDCYSANTDIRTAFISAFDPDTCLELLELAANHASQRT